METHLKLLALPVIMKSHRHRWTRLNPSQACRYSNYLPR